MVSMKHKGPRLGDQDFSLSFVLGPEDNSLQDYDAKNTRVRDSKTKTLIKGNPG